MNLENLCKYCFSPISSPSGRCPNCQHETDEERPLTYLPLETILNGKYIVGKVLGQGGFGITYLAYDLNLEMPVAIKEYFPTGMLTRSTNRFEVIPMPHKKELFEQGLNQFLTEARILAQLKNIPNIVGVLNSFREHGTAYYVMDYIQGDSIKDIVKRDGVFRYDNAIRLLLPVIDALEKVHAQGIFHRDISPDNIYITQNGIPKLLDFGAALISADETSIRKESVLKPGFAPKEQYRKNEPQGAWTDVYAMAATLYFMVTGRRPLDSLDRANKDELIYPSQIGAFSPATLDVVLKKALSVEASGRYQTMEEFSGALKAVLEGDVKAVTKTTKNKKSSDKKSFPLIPVIIAGAAVLAAAVVAIVLLTGEERASAEPHASEAKMIAVQAEEEAPEESISSKAAIDLSYTIEKLTFSDAQYEYLFNIPRFTTSNGKLLEILNKEITGPLQESYEYRKANQIEGSPSDYKSDYFEGAIIQSCDENYVQAILYYCDTVGTHPGGETSTCIDVRKCKKISLSDLFEPGDWSRMKIYINSTVGNLLNGYLDSTVYTTTVYDYSSQGTPFVINAEGLILILSLSNVVDAAVDDETVMVKFPWSSFDAQPALDIDKLPEETELDFAKGSQVPAIQSYIYGDYYSYVFGGELESFGDESTAESYNTGSSPDPDEAYYQSIDAFIFEGKSRYYTYDELINRSQWELCIIRNGMFALSGKIFTGNQWCIDYFPTRSWYTPIKSNVRDDMNEYQKANANFIAEIERIKGWRE